jgi:hypothetical protein
MELSVLIERVNSLAGDRGALEKIATAEELTAELGRLGDRLIGYFVEQARAEGFSWTDIGEHLGVSRQAAQQRYTARRSTLSLDDLVRAGAFQRLAPRAQTALTNAVEHARRLSHATITPTGILLGILDDPEALAVKVIAALGGDRERIRAAVESAPAESSESPTVIPVDPEARRALGKAMSEALDLGHNYLGTEHLLLGILHDPQTVPGRVLLDAGISLENARSTVQDIIADVLRKAN